MPDRLQEIIDDAWERRESLGPDAASEVHAAVETALDGLDAGRLRVAAMVHCRRLI